MKYNLPTEPVDYSYKIIYIICNVVVGTASQGNSCKQRHGNI